MESSLPRTEYMGLWSVYRWMTWTDLPPEVHLGWKEWRGSLKASKWFDMGPITYYLGLKVECDRARAKRTIKLSQPAYFEKVLDWFNLLQAKTASTPMKESSLLAPNTKDAIPQTITKFQAIVESIMFAMQDTRPDIAFTTSAISRYAQNLSKQHIEAAKTVLRYLSGIRNKGITWLRGWKVRHHRLFRRRLGKEQKWQKINLCEQRADKLVLKEANLSSIVVDRSRIHGADTCSKRNHVAKTTISWIRTTERG